MLYFTKLNLWRITKYHELWRVYLWGSSSRLWNTTADHNRAEWPQTPDTAYEVHIHGVQSSAGLQDPERPTNNRGIPCRLWYSGWVASCRRTPTSSQSLRRGRIEPETSRSCSIPALRLHRKAANTLQIPATYSHIATEKALHGSVAVLGFTLGASGVAIIAARGHGPILPRWTTPNKW